MIQHSLPIEEKILECGQYVPDLYPEGIDSKIILNKGIPGIRATTCELEAPRHSIIVVPSQPIVGIKQEKYPQILGVQKGVYEPKIKEYLLRKEPTHKKIIVTPESYNKVVKAAKSAGVNLFKEYFLMIDECEKAVQDADFREDVIAPFFDFFEYESKCLLSATPLFPNLKGFSRQEFRVVKIVPNYPYEKELLLVGTNNVPEEVIERIHKSDNKLAIFLNSLKYAKMIINRAEIKDHAKIYTSVDEVAPLLKEGYKAAHKFGINEVMEKYSIFTSRFYSGVDMDTADTPDLLIVTDCLSKPQTMIDPFTHAIQISGRFRAGIGTITHVTNHDWTITTMSRDDFSKYFDEQKTLYDAIQTLKEVETGGGKALLKEIEERTPFSRFVFKSGRYKGMLNPFLVECYIQKERVKGLYRNLRLLEEAYRQTGYFIITYENKKHKKGSGRITPGVKKLSKARKMEIVKRLEVLIPKSDESMILRFRTDEEESELSSLRQEAPDLCRYYEKFGSAKLEEIDYNTNQMKRELKQVGRKELYFVPLDEIYNSFAIGHRYSESDIIETLQAIFDKYELVNDDEKPLKAHATDLGKYFDLSKRITMPNSREKGYIALKKKFSLD